jgi:type IV pilus assembly protein PilM
MRNLDFKNIFQNLLTRPEPESVVIDLGAGYVKAMRVSGSQIKNFVLEKSKANPARTAIEWLKQENLLSLPLKIAIKGQDTLIRYISFPKVDKKTLKSAVGFELGKYIPFGKDDVYFDVAILNENQTINEYFLLLAVTKKDSLDAMIKEFQNAKANITKITLNNLALLNLFMSFPPQEINEPTTEAPVAAAVKNGPAVVNSALQNIALVDIGVSATLISLLKENIPCLSRETKICCGTFLQKLAKAKNMKPDQVENYVDNMYAPKAVSEVQEILEVIEEVCLSLSEDIKNSLDYFEVNWGKRVQRIYLTGGFSRIKGIDRIIESSLGITTKIWDPFSSFALSYDKKILNNKEFMAVALGLTL